MVGIGVVSCLVDYVLVNTITPGWFPSVGETPGLVIGALRVVSNLLSGAMVVRFIVLGQQAASREAQQARFENAQQAEAEREQRHYLEHTVQRYSEFATAVGGVISTSAWSCSRMTSTRVIR